MKLAVGLLLVSALAFGQPASQDAAAPASSSQAPEQSARAQQPSNERGGQLSQRGYDRIVKEVHHELVMLPRYNLFDDLRYQGAPDGTVTLTGEVANATLKPDAEKAVRSIEGVENVVNNIKILPTSQRDQRIRREAYRAIYGSPALAPYAIQSIPPIHIIVENGHVTLNGAVGSQVDKQIAVTRVKQIPDVFDVTDNLQINP
jgi:hypothetical protein